MILYYRMLGLVVVVGLCRVAAACSGRSSPASSKTTGLALTLAGVTGIIVSIGVTVDSYVVYFERLKDDVRSGEVAPGLGAQRGFRARGARSSPPTSCR